MLTEAALQNTFSKEQTLLILTARIYFKTATAESVNNFILCQNINWSQFYLLCRQHGVRAFVYHIFTDSSIVIPEYILQNLKRHSLSISMTGIRMSVIQKVIVEELSTQHKIFIRPYKGMSIANTYYKQSSMRESIDLDFLISKKDIAAIEDYLIKNNYVPKHTVARPYLPFYARWFKDMVYQTTNDNQSKKFSVEMHWRLADRFAGKMPDYYFFHNNQELNNTEKDFLLIAINHFAKDLFCKFKYCIDAAAIIYTKGNEISYSKLQRIAIRYGFEKRMQTGLGITNNLLGIGCATENKKFSKEIVYYSQKALQQLIYIKRNYITDKKFMLHAFLLQDTAIKKLQFAVRCFLYVFIPTELDLKNYRLPVYTLPVLLITRPLRLLYNLLFKQQ